MPEPGRQAAFVMLDALTGWSEDAASEVNVPAVNLAWQRLNDIEGAVTAKFDDETDVVDLDVSNMLGGTLVAMNCLVTRLAVATDRDRVDVIAEVREFLNERD